MEAKLIREMVEAYASVYDQDLNEMKVPPKDYGKMQKPKPQKPPVKGPIGRGPSGKPVKNGGPMGEQSVFDIIKGHLLDEGYADTEQAALAIMANMSEEWKQSIVEVVTTTGQTAPKAVPSQMFPGRPFVGAERPFQQPFINPSGERAPVDKSLFKGASKPVKKDTKTA